MKTRCLIYVISPIHALSALCAVSASHGLAEVEMTVVVHWPGSDISPELAEIVRDMMRAFPFVRTLSLAQPRLNEILEIGSRAAVIDAIKRELSLDGVDEIYYPHDVVGQLYQALATSYPGARRVCIGDAMGYVYERNYRLSYLKKQNLPRRLLGSAWHFLDNAVWRMSEVILRRKKQLALGDFPPHAASLVMPIDPSGKFLARLPLTICPKPVVLDLLTRCADSCERLRQYIGELLARYQSRRTFLLLTENGAECGLVDFDREIEMYCSLIEDACEPGSVVLLKSHPAESLPRNQRIQERLGSRYEVVQLDPRFRRYPVELWRDLVLASTVVCMSSPVLTLKYLYGIDVIQPMNEAFIDRWYPERSRNSYRNALELYMKPTLALAAWDGKSVLWPAQQSLE